MEKGNICPICGEPTYLVYGKHPRKDGLCYKHSQMLFNKEIEQCPECGKWHKTDDNCDCKKLKNKTVTIEEQTDRKISSDITCIICGEPSNGKHFCRSCYAKYKDRSVDLRITHCTETEILDEYGNLIYTCDDGRKVRSRAEAIICSWLYNNKIRIKYEEPVYYLDEESGETKTLHPDFFLPDYELYIEYNELSNPKYLKSKEYTQKIYNKLGLKVLIMTDKDLQDVAACLKPRLFIR